jgi:hypothetical protein
MAGAPLHNSGNVRSATEDLSPHKRRSSGESSFAAENLAEWEIGCFAALKMPPQIIRWKVIATASFVCRGYLF